jgi:hypothetical protein
MGLMFKNGGLLGHRLGSSGGFALTMDEDLCDCDCGEVPPDYSCQCYTPPDVGETMDVTVVSTDCGACPPDWQMAWESTVGKWLYGNFLCSDAPMVYFVIELSCESGDCPSPDRSYWLYFSWDNSENPGEVDSVSVLCEMISPPPNLILEATITISTPASLCSGAGMTFTVRISDSP